MVKRLKPVMLVLCLAFLILAGCDGSKESKSGKEGALRSKPDQIDNNPVQKVNNNELPENNADTGSADPIPEVKITVDLPEGWDDTSGQKNTLASYERETNMVQVTAAWAPREVQNTKDFAEYEKEQIKDYFENAVFSDIESYTLSGLEGSCMTIDITISKNIKQKQIYVFINKDGKYYKVVAVFFVDDKKIEKDVETIMNSMKIE